MGILTCNPQQGMRLALLVLLALLPMLQTFAAELATTEVITDPAQLARTNYEAAVARFRREPDSAEAALGAGRACFELAEFAARKAERASLANEGIAACQRALALQTNSGAAHYYLGVNLGQLARTKGWGALKMVNQLRDEFEAAANLDPHVNHAGPDRNLGYLYRDTPSFSLGDKQEAAKHLERAVKLAPDYPENRLSLIEGLLKWGERKRAREELKTLEESLPEARTRFTGPAFAPNWTDWDQRLKEVQAKAHEQKKFLGIFGSGD